MALSADGGSEGQGGTISLNDPNAGFIIAGSAISVQGGAGQKAGNITVDAGETLSVSGILKANGTGGGDGGFISLTAVPATTPLTFVSGTQILATGKTGGEIRITNLGQSKVNFETASVASVSSVNGDGIGGTLVIANSGGEFSLLGNLTANGHGTGKAGVVRITAATVTIGDDSSNPLDIAIQANGKGDFPTNGEIEVTAIGTFKLTTAVIQANGIGSKDGGSITLAGGAVELRGAVDASSQENGNSGIVAITQTNSTASDLILENSGITTRGKGNNVTTNVRIRSSVGLSVRSNAVINASARNTGRGGRISLEYAIGVANREFSMSSASEIVSRGGSTTGNGGRVTATGIQGGRATIAGTILVDGTNGGRIDITTGSSGVALPISLGPTSLLSASGAALNGDGGTIVLTEDVQGGFGPPILVEGVIVADAGSLSGAGGSVVFRNSGPGDLFVTGQPASVISARSGNLSFIKQNRNLRITAEELSGSVIATGKDVLVTITGMQPSPPTPANVLALEVVTASNGNVQINAGDAQVVVTPRGLPQASISATGNVRIAGRGITIGAGALSGNDFVQGANINLSTSGDTDSDILLGADLKSDGTITLAANGDLGNILSNGGFIRSVSGVPNTLIVTTKNGNIGDLNGNAPLMTEVTTIRANTRQMGPGTVNIRNVTTFGTQIANGSGSGGSFKLSASGDLTAFSTRVGDFLSENPDNLLLLKLSADAGTLQIASGSLVEAVRGGVELQMLDVQDGQITVSLQGQVTAITDDGKPVGVLIYRGSSFGLDDGVQPANVSPVVDDPGKIFWGAVDGNGKSITASPSTPTNIVRASKRPVLFDAKGDSTKILLDGQTQITAQGQ